MADEVISEIRQSLSLPSNTEAEAIYQAITDVSYSRGGACIGIINEDTLPPRLEEIVQSGILSYSNADRKLKALIEMISNVNNGVKQKKSFYQLNRTLRRELLELDGAMVFSKSGVIHVIGTIIKLEGSDSSGGGRTAAAMQLSEFGLAIKVSQDGYIQLFRERQCILDVMT